MSRSILHCDMNNFYASVECMLDPTLKKYPVAVCGSVEERHGIVLAKNYAAKAFGVATGDAVWQAKQKCKDLVIVPPHYEEYIKYSKLARSVYSRFTDQVEPYGMDECWLDISGTEKLYGSPERVANEILLLTLYALKLMVILWSVNVCTELYSMLLKYFKKSTVVVGNRKHGPHALRHSLAARLLDNNTPMPVITGILGHKNINTTSKYLSIDIEGLRRASLEVPTDEN